MHLSPDQVSGFEPWAGTLCCILRQDTVLSECLSTQVYKIMVTGKLNAGGNPAMDQHPIKGESGNTPSGSMLQKPG